MPRRSPGTERVASCTAASPTRYSALKHDHVVPGGHPRDRSQAVVRVLCATPKAAAEIVDAVRMADSPSAATHTSSANAPKSPVPNTGRRP